MAGIASTFDGTRDDLAEVVSLASSTRTPDWLHVAAANVADGQSDWSAYIEPELDPLAVLQQQAAELTRQEVARRWYASIRIQRRQRGIFARGRAETAQSCRRAAIIIQRAMRRFATDFLHGECTRTRLRARLVRLEAYGASTKSQYRKQLRSLTQCYLKLQQRCTLFTVFHAWKDSFYLKVATDGGQWSHLLYSRSTAKAQVESAKEDAERQVVALTAQLSQQAGELNARDNELQQMRVREKDLGEQLITLRAASETAAADTATSKSSGARASFWLLGIAVAVIAAAVTAAAVTAFDGNMLKGSCTRKAPAVEQCITGFGANTAGDCAKLKDPKVIENPKLREMISAEQH